MATPITEIERLRERIRGRIEELRRRRIGPRGQVKLGGGELIRMATTRLDELTSRLLEMRPNIISQIVELKPGERVRRVVSEVIPGTATGARTEVDVGVEKKERVVRKNISVDI